MAGKYTNATGASACHECASHAISDIGSVGCECRPGYEGDGDVLCTACPAGKSTQTEPKEERLVCSDTRSAAPFCEVSFSGVRSGPPVLLTIEVANTDFSGSNEYVSSVRAGSLWMGAGFLASGGQDGNCGKMDKILDSVPVPAGATSNGLLTVRIETTPAVGCCRCQGATLYAVVTMRRVWQLQPVCADCGAGTYSNSSAATNCAFCPAGKYVNTSSASVCSSCAPGSFPAILALSLSLIHI